MGNQTSKTLGEQLVSHIRGGKAFIPVENIINKIAFDKVGLVPGEIPYSFYQQFYHLRLAQYDIMEFTRNPNYTFLNWPDEYWPSNPKPVNKQEWQQLVENFFFERREFCEYIIEHAHDLYLPIPHGSGQTLLREALLVIEHNAYHTGQLLIILRLLKLF